MLRRALRIRRVAPHSRAACTLPCCRARRIRRSSAYPRALIAGRPIQCLKPMAARSQHTKFLYLWGQQRSNNTVSLSLSPLPCAPQPHVSVINSTITTRRQRLRLRLAATSRTIRCFTMPRGPTTEPHTHTQTHRHCMLVYAVCRSPRVCTATDTVRATLFVTRGDAVSFVICDSDTASNPSALLLSAAGEGRSSSSSSAIDSPQYRSLLLISAPRSDPTRQYRPCEDAAGVAQVAAV